MIIFVTQKILFLILILLIIMKIIIFITQTITFRNLRLQNHGSWRRTRENWVLRKTHYPWTGTGRKTIGSWRRIEENGVRTLDPLALGPLPMGPNRVERVCKPQARSSENPLACVCSQAREFDPNTRGM